MTGPLVVAGAARSGTAGLARAAAGLLRRPVHEAGMALSLLGAWREGAARYGRAMARACPGQPAPALPESALAALPRDAVLRAADLLPSADSLRALPALLEAWPTARAACVWRHGVGFVDSRRRALPHLSFADHCLTWAASQDAIATLAARFGGRVLLVAHHDMARDMAGVARRLAGFLGLEEAAAAELPMVDWPGRAAAAAPPAALARTSWTLPEIELFDGLCGEAMRRIGDPPDRAAAARARPMDLVEAVQAGQARTGGALRLGLPRAPDAGLRLRLSPGQGRLSLPSLWPAGRDRLELHLGGATRPVAMEWRLVGSLSRRPLLQRAVRLEPGSDVEVTARLPPTDELLDLVLLTDTAEAAAFEWRQARLFRL